MNQQLEQTTNALLARVERAANNDDVAAEVVAEMATAAAQLVVQIEGKKETAGGTAVSNARNQLAIIEGVLQHAQFSTDLGSERVRELINNLEAQRCYFRSLLQRHAEQPRPQPSGM